MTISAIHRDAATAQFFDGTAAGEFRLRRSRVTGEVLAPQCVIDSTGSTDLEWIVAAGTGRLVSWAVSFGKPKDGVQVAQSVVGIVQLDEGPWWWAEILEANPEAMRADLPVYVDFVRPEGSPETVPAFRVRS
jgi:uncharacterized OB-fold protein